jgi:hypothetical protein
MLECPRRLRESGEIRADHAWHAHCSCAPVTNSTERTSQAPEARSTFEHFDFEDVTMTETLPASVRAELKSIDLKSLQLKGLALKKFEQNFEVEVDTSLDFEDVTMTEMLTRDFGPAPSKAEMSALSGSIELTSMEVAIVESDALDSPPALPFAMRPKADTHERLVSDEAWLMTLPEETRRELEAVRNGASRWPLAPRLSHAIAKPVVQS